MTKLLSADLSRLWKNKFFWAGLAVFLAVSVLNMLNASDYDEFDYYYFYMGPFLGIFFAPVMSLFLGTEYSDGALRNKLISGHTRASIYLANLITCMAAGLIFVAVWLLSGLIGIPVLGVWSIGIPQVLLYILINILAAMQIVAIMTLIGQLRSNKASSAVASIFVSLILLIAASLLYNRLCEPETVSGMYITADGILQPLDPEPNPRYIGGTLRSVLTFILNVLPTGQMILTTQTEITQPFLNIAASLAVTAIVTIFGTAAFNRKDLK